VTFSIVARSADARLHGVAVASSSPAVAARRAHARAGAGAVATQNITDPALGPYILDALSRGASAEAALAQAVRSTPFAAYRQLVVVGRKGAPAVHSGAQALGSAATVICQDAAAAGNLLSHQGIPGLMLTAFEHGAGHLGARLIGALRAAVEQGGEVGPIHSAGLLIVREVEWPIVDLRVDWTERDPVAELDSIWQRYEPQIEDYVQRALDPTRAPSFGVPGNL
jgi:uncharacterized Ntn-hydrolase superfamily protein